MTANIGIPEHIGNGNMTQYFHINFEILQQSPKHIFWYLPPTSGNSIIPGQNKTLWKYYRNIMRENIVLPRSDSV